jgi:hypothetical protein
LTGRSALRLLPIVVALVLAAVALGAPRFTWANEGVIVDHPWTHPAAAVAGALAAGTAALLSRPRALAATLGCGGLLLLALAASQVRYRIDALEAGLQKRTLTGAVRFAWGELEAVEPRANAINLRSRDGRAVVIETSRFAPEDRNRLERTIARRVKEAAR